MLPERQSKYAVPPGGGKPEAPLPVRTCGINQIPLRIGQIPFEERAGVRVMQAL
jgi:hypothetical protein